MSIIRSAGRHARPLSYAASAAVLLGALALTLVSPGDVAKASCFQQKPMWSYAFSGGKLAYHTIYYVATGSCTGDKGTVTYGFHQSSNSSMGMYQHARDWECGSLAYSNQPSSSWTTSNSVSDYAYPGYCGFQQDSNASFSSGSTVWHYYNY